MPLCRLLKCMWWFPLSWWMQKIKAGYLQVDASLSPIIFLQRFSFRTNGERKLRGQPANPVSSRKWHSKPVCACLCYLRTEFLREITELEVQLFYSPTTSTASNIKHVTSHSEHLWQKNIPENRTRVKTVHVHAKCDSTKEAKFGIWHNIMQHWYALSINHPVIHSWSVNLHGISQTCLLWLWTFEKPHVSLELIIPMSHSFSSEGR